MSISSRWTPPCTGAPSCARQGAQVYLHSLFPYLLDKLLVCLENELETREESQGGGGRRAEVASPWSLDERLGPKGGGAAHGTPEEDVHAGLVGPPAGTLHHPPVARGPVLHQRGLLPPGEQDGQHPLSSGV